MEIRHCDLSTWSDLNKECYIMQVNHAPDFICFYTQRKKGDFLTIINVVAFFKIKKKSSSLPVDVQIQNHLS